MRGYFTKLAQKVKEYRTASDAWMAMFVRTGDCDD